MFLSHFNENYIKNHINDADKKKGIEEITKQIEAMEKDMLEELNTGYLSVINKCSKLEILGKYMENVQGTNNELFTSTNELILRSCNIEDTQMDITQWMERLEDIKKEFTLVKSFIEIREEYDKCENVFISVRNLKKMEKMLSYFKKYNFNMSLNKIYRDMYSDFITILQHKIKNWLETIDYVNIGRSVEVLDYKYRIFDDLNVYRQELIKKEFLKVYFAAKELKIEPIIIETINNNRLFSRNISENTVVGTQSSLNMNRSSNTNSEDIRNRLHQLSLKDHPRNLAKNKKVEDSVDKLDKTFITKNQLEQNGNQIYSGEYEEFYAMISNILLSYFLKDFFPRVSTFYDDIFDEISKINFTDYNMIKQTLFPLKKLVTVLHLDSEKLDLIIEKVACSFFDSHKEKDIKFLYKFIDDSCVFLDKLTQFNNELDELMAVKIDKILIEYFDKQMKNVDLTEIDESSKKFVNCKKEIIKILAYLKSKNKFFGRKNYEIENSVFLAEEQFINVKTGEILENKNINKVVKKVVGLRNFMDEIVQRKILRKISAELEEYYKGDDLVLYKDTIRRNFSDLGGVS